MLRYNEEGALLEDATRAKKIKNLATQFTIINGELYKIWQPTRTGWLGSIIEKLETEPFK